MSTVYATIIGNCEYLLIEGKTAKCNQRIKNENVVEIFKHSTQNELIKTPLSYT